MIHSIERCTEIQKDQQGHVLFIHVEKKIVLNFKQRCFGAVVFPVCRLGTRVEIVNTHVGVCLIEDCSLSQLGYKLQIAYRPKVFEN